MFLDSHPVAADSHIPYILGVAANEYPRTNAGGLAAVVDMLGLCHSSRCHSKTPIALGTPLELRLASCAVDGETRCWLARRRYGAVA